MTSATFCDFLTPSPLVTVTNQLILFLLSAFWEFGRHIWKPLNSEAGKLDYVEVERTNLAGCPLLMAASLCKVRS